MEGITADDGYGNDITSTIVLTKPDNLNVYNPMPGDYTIDLEFTHHVHFAGIAAEVTADGVAYAYDTLNSDQGYNGDHLAVYDDLTNFRNIETEYAMIYIVVGGDGTIVGIYDRYNWNWTTPDADNDGNPEVDSSTYNGDPLQWQADLTLEDGGFVLVVGRYNASKTALRALPIGTNVSFVLGTEDQDFDILVEESYVLTVDDITAPKAVVVDDNYEVEIGEYETVDAAILANVVGFDFYDDSEDLTIYVSNNGSLALDTEGTYTVEVTVEDQAGNTTVVEFDVTVVAPLDVQGLIDSQTVNSDDVQGMLDDQLMTDAQVQKLIDDTLAAETGCGGSIGAGSITLVALSVIGIAAFVIIRKK
jgi:hypothetical protein